MAEIGVDILKAADLLKMGELVGIPTETVYGLAADALNPDAVLNVFKTKGRPSFDPLICHFSSFVKAQSYIQHIPEEVYALVDAFMPGPLTLILPKKNISDIVTSGHSTVAIRVPAHPITHELLELFEGPIAAPSANPFGFVSPTTAQHVNDQLGEKIKYILDGGPCTVGLESTIIEYKEGKAVVLRLGGLALEQIEEVLGHKVDQIQTSSSNPKAPGMLSSHYSPGIPLQTGSVPELLAEHKNKRLGLICLQKGEHPVEAFQEVMELSEEGNLEEAARNIFKALHEMRSKDVELIIAERMPESFLGRAINDRLKRASVQSSSD